jgi:hypothetical protein
MLAAAAFDVPGEGVALSRLSRQYRIQQRVRIIQRILRKPGFIHIKAN